MTVFGIDCSDFDWARGPMDIAAMARDGIVFLTHKATEGTSVRHQHYGPALTRARDAGIPVLGAYHVVRSAGSLADQVKAHLAYLDEATPWWRTWPAWIEQVDLELWPYDQVSASTGVAFAELLATATRKAVLIYASKGQYGQALGGGRPLWNAAYPSRAPGHYRELYPGDNGPGWQSYSGRTPVMWQYTDNATIGSQPGCDANAFRGSLAELLALAGGPHIDIVAEEAVMFFAQQGSTIYLCDGMHSRDVTHVLGDLKTLIAEGHVKVTNSPDQPRGGFYPGAFGTPDTAPATVDVVALAASLAAAGVGQVDVAALAAVLEQHLPSHITLTGTIA